MIPEDLSGFLWLLLLLGPLFFLQRRLHREIQAVLLLLTRRPDITVTLFSIIFLPGVILHETSHFVMAHLLGVRTGRFSIIPRTFPRGRLQLGYVETETTDWFRDALIGFAPLLVGGVFVAYGGQVRLGLPHLGNQLLSLGIPSLLDSLKVIYSRSDFWLWFYLTFAVSSTMLPSASDRRAWLPIVLFFLTLFGVLTFAGAGEWMVQNLASPVNSALQAMAIVVGISAFIHFLLLPPLWIVRSIISKLVGLHVV